MISSFHWLGKSKKNMKKRREIRNKIGKKLNDSNPYYSTIKEKSKKSVRIINGIRIRKMRELIFL